MLKPVFGGKDYIMRYEFQHRGSIHCHMVISVESGPNSRTMELAGVKLPVAEERKAKDLLHDAIWSSREEVVKFSALTVGISTVHPSLDPKEWPAPLGQNVYKPRTDALRKGFENIVIDPLLLTEQYKQLVNRVLLHKCKLGYCINKNRYEMVVNENAPLTKKGKPRKKKKCCSVALTSRLSTLVMTR